MTPDLFLHEDLSKPENRINLAIFGLMCAHDFRTWFQEQLGLPAEAVLYPTINVEGVRPDFAVKNASTDETLAWIEVECGKDQEQVDRFRRRLSEPVLTIWGRTTHGSDLSLEQIKDFLHGWHPAEPQVRFNAEHLRQQIVEVLDGRVGTHYPTQPVSAAMRATPFVAAITEALHGQLSFAVTGAVRPGEIRANTKGDAGFSLRVHSPIAGGDKSLSILSQTGGRPQLWFQSEAKLRRYLPAKATEITRLVGVVHDMGGDMSSIAENGKTSIPIEVAAQYVTDLAEVVTALASVPARA